MNVSSVITNLTAVSQRTPSVASGGGDMGVKMPMPSGKFLPELAQVLPSQTSSKGNDPTSQPGAEELRGLIEQANSAPPIRSSNLKFSVAEGTDINVVRIEDSETGELIRQIPSEAMVAIARALSEQSHGAMLEEKV